MCPPLIEEIEVEEIGAPHVCVTHKVRGRAPCEIGPSGAALRHRKARTARGRRAWFSEVSEMMEVGAARLARVPPRAAARCAVRLPLEAVGARFARNGGKSAPPNVASVSPLVLCRQSSGRFARYDRLGDDDGASDRRSACGAANLGSPRALPDSGVGGVLFWRADRLCAAVAQRPAIRPLASEFHPARGSSDYPNPRLAGIPARGVSSTDAGRLGAPARRRCRSPSSTSPTARMPHSAHSWSGA